MKATTVLAGICALLISSSVSLAERGRDDQVNIIYWQAPSILNPYLSGGLKDIEAASLILEPLARYDETGTMVAWLAEDIPTVENGGVSQDLREITWTLRTGLVWSDGSPVTSEDVRFTWAYCTADGGGCASAQSFQGIDRIDTPDARTVRIVFQDPKPFPYAPFVGPTTPILQAAQFADCLGPRAPACTAANFGPIGTGPFMITDFRPNDVAVFEANPQFRDPTKPAFARVMLKGGGDADTAARATLGNAEFDYAWNLQLPPKVLNDLQANGEGQVVSAFGTLVERIVLNRTDPSADLGATRSTTEHPHPFLNDPAVRQALSMAIDRTILVDIGYGDAGRPTCNILPAPAIYRSSANEGCLVQDVEGAKALLESAGWVEGADGVRSKDGVRLSLIFQTSTNAVRQTFQALIKQWWSEIGVETELRNINPNVFFGSDSGSPDTFQKFYADVQMYANSFDGTDPEAYLGGWQCNRIPTLENQWQGTNIERFCMDDYDALVRQMRETGALEDRAALARQMNDLLVQSYTVLPLVDRGRVSGHVNTLGGVIMNPWDSELWNIADWYRIEE